MKITQQRWHMKTVSTATSLALSVLLLLLVLAPAVRSGRETAFRED